MKAQITIFIIIGALVVAAFGITLYVGGKMSERVEAKGAEARIEQLGIGPIQDYITTCLELATKEGLALIGRQGGAIYKKQGGLTEDFSGGEGTNHVKYTDPELGILDVSFLILPPEGNVSEMLFSMPPAYPFPGFPYPPGETTPLFKGYYGMSKLPPLYKISAETGQPVSGSIQENLETFIAKKTSECATWQTFEDKGYGITAGTAVASLLFANQSEQFRGEQNINVELLWPVEITTPGGDKALLKDFAIREQVRLATIYYTVKTIIDSDVTDISYVPEGAGAFTATVYQYDKDSFVIVKDGQSIVGNKPFEFWIPRKNRKPALWAINTEPLQQVKFHVTREGVGAEITTTENALRIDDPCQEAGVQDPYIIELMASDPDEEKASFAASIPVSSDRRIPRTALDFAEFSITVFAHDKSATPASKYDTEQFDSQEIPLQVALCEES